MDVPRATTEELWKDGIARGKVLGRFLEREIGGLGGLRVLDIGCATGGISLALAERASNVVGIDLSLANLSEATVRVDSLAGNSPKFITASGLELPLSDASFDLVLLIGVLEYMGRGAPGLSPRDAQARCITEIARVLTDDGSVVVAIENRWYPPFLLRSPHQGVPAGLLLPHSIAHKVTNRWRSGQMWEGLHGYRGLCHLFHECGFARTAGYLPVYGYQFPKAIVAANDRRTLWRVADRSNLGASTGYEEHTTGGRWGPSWFRLIAALGLQKLFAPALLVIASK